MSHRSKRTPSGINGDERRPDIAMPEPDYRFTLANERTFLAWQRTSLSQLAAAAALFEFSRPLAEGDHLRPRA